MADLAGVLADLRDEGESLDALVSGLEAGDWARPTPAAGWTIADQIGHLAWTDDIALLAATDVPAFTDLVQSALAQVSTPDEFAGYTDRAAAARAELPPAELVRGWRAGRAAVATALSEVTRGTKLPWFGPPMSAMSMATARLMETWAHGQDVADALGASRRATDRLRHVAHIGVRTRDFAYHGRGLTPPADPFRVELVGPSGALWTWGPAEAVGRVTGPALDFCLLVTQRRHRDDLEITAVGAEAAAWLDIAQAFAGPSGAGRERGQFAGRPAAAP